MQSSLEMRLDMLEDQLEQAQAERRRAEATQVKYDRMAEELETNRQEDCRTIKMLEELLESLETKAESYKSQAEEAREVADRNLNLFRRKQQELEEMEIKAREAEEELAKIKVQRRTTNN
eukprot:TRINITY_DN1528_c2_g1_i2.p1 TRINITY_DN1528_c2_g1~~TRINITY_DN1528_c2_g1_i2.p1  ORF type:complete len:133 (-),score=37.41 TRINITY_DN1528_c2_g1_i2:73-432(-)